MNTNMINLAYDAQMLGHGYKLYVPWDYALYPHLLTIGNSGSGKSYFLKTLLGRVAQIPNSRAWICDFKNDDFAFLGDDSHSRFYGYKDVETGFNEFYALFETRLCGDKCRDCAFLLIDEYVSWLARMDKKDAEEVKRRMATLLFMSRAFNLHVLLSTQRGMAETFAYGSRDCLNVILLGTPSRESVHSFCSAEDARHMLPCGQGAGYVLFDGKIPQAFTVPTIRNMNKLNTAILDLASR